jgi:predicted protein tyrosine phosphatase
MPNILFVCGKNKWRSPTAQAIYKNDSRVNVRSAGVKSDAKRKISKKDIEWADLILVMENKYRKWIKDHFKYMYFPTIDSLEIPDNYNFMDEELIELIRSGTEPYV